MWRAWLFSVALLAIVVGVVLASYEKLRPSRTLRHASGVFALAGAALMLPVLVERSLELPVLWVTTVFLALVLVGGTWIVAHEIRRHRRQAARSTNTLVAPPRWRTRTPEETERRWPGGQLGGGPTD